MRELHHSCSFAKLTCCSTDDNDFPEQLLPALLAAISKLLNGSRQQPRDIATQVLNAVLGKKQMRSAVWAEGTCISG